MPFTSVQKLSIGTGAALGLLALVGLISSLSITALIGGARVVAGTNANIARLDRVIATLGRIGGQSLSSSVA